MLPYKTLASIIHEKKKRKRKKSYKNSKVKI